MSLSTFDLAKQRQGFQPGAARPRCGNCLRVSDTGDGLICTRGGFYCSSYSVCDQHEPVARPQGRPSSSAG